MENISSSFQLHPATVYPTTVYPTTVYPTTVYPTDHCKHACHAIMSNYVNQKRPTFVNEHLPVDLHKPQFHSSLRISRQLIVQSKLHIFQIFPSEKRQKKTDNLNLLPSTAERAARSHMVGYFVNPLLINMFCPHSISILYTDIYNATERYNYMNELKKITLITRLLKTKQHNFHKTYFVTHPR